MPFFGIVLLVSFIKNMYTYLFVATQHHNKLLWINLLSVLIGLGAGSALIYYFALLGAVVGQMLYGLVFLLLFAYFAYRYDVVPRFALKDLLKVVGFFFVLLIVGSFVDMAPTELITFFSVAAIANLLILALWFPWLKRIAK